MYASESVDIPHLLAVVEEAALVLMSATAPKDSKEPTVIPHNKVLLSVTKEPIWMPKYAPDTVLALHQKSVLVRQDIQVLTVRLQFASAKPVHQHALRKESVSLLIPALATHYTQVQTVRISNAMELNTRMHLYVPEEIVSPLIHVRARNLDIFKTAQLQSVEVFCLLKQTSVAEEENVMLQTNVPVTLLHLE